MLHQKGRKFFIMLPKMSGYAKSFDKTKCMSFLIKNDELLKNMKSEIKSEKALKWI